MHYIFQCKKIARLFNSTLNMFKANNNEVVDSSDKVNKTKKF